LSSFLTTDEALHHAVDLSQIIMLDLESIRGTAPEPELAQKLMRIEQHVLKQTEYLASARRQLREMAPQDSAIFHQLDVVR
jgi:sensor histidine kinase regulating citrate/malate metabolism